MRPKDIPPHIEPGRYLHYKGDIYQTEGKVALDTEKEDRWLLIYNKVGETMLNARPVEMFFEEVVVDGQPIPRFKKLD